jgi:hypothetical protein
MAKKQTRRSISVSRTTYERLKAFCEANNISMSQLVETRVNDFLGDSGAPVVEVDLRRPVPALAPVRPTAPPPAMATAMRPPVAAPVSSPAPVRPPAEARPAAPQPVPMTSAAARFVVEPPPPIIKPKQETAAPKPAEKRPDQIFTF